MILPTRSMPAATAMITVGSDVLAELESSGLTVSSLWDRVSLRITARTQVPVTFDWFILTLDMLYALKLIHIGRTGYLERRLR